LPLRVASFFFPALPFVCVWAKADDERRANPNLGNGLPRSEVGFAAAAALRAALRGIPLAPIRGALSGIHPPPARSRDVRTRATLRLLPWTPRSLMPIGRYESHSALRSAHDRASGHARIVPGSRGARMLRPASYFRTKVPRCGTRVRRYVVYPFGGRLMESYTNLASSCRPAGPARLRPGRGRVSLPDRRPSFLVPNESNRALDRALLALRVCVSAGDLARLCRISSKR